jgi:transposase-like protein
VKEIETLAEAIEYFEDADRCHEYVKSMRWSDRVNCIYCGSENVGEVASRRLFQCRACRRQFSIKVGTIFEDSPLRLGKWLCTVWMVVNCKNGISSYEVHRALGITQKSAWFMLERIREAVGRGTVEKAARSKPPLS